MIWAWIDTSRALMGSSATIRSGLQGEGPGDADALPLAAGELVRVAVREVRVRARRSRAARGPRSRRSARSPMPWISSGSAMIPPARHPRVQARVRVLEDHLHPAARLRELAALRASAMSMPSNMIASGGRLVEADDRPTGRALAAARFADEAERLAAARSRS